MQEGKIRVNYSFKVARIIFHEKFFEAQGSRKDILVRGDKMRPNWEENHPPCSDIDLSFCN